jgi:hypothetical protein
MTSYAQESARTIPSAMNDLTVEVTGASREIVYTNKQGGVFYTETSAEHRSLSQGWRIRSHELLEDYSLTVNTKPLRKQDVVRAVVSPYQLKRIYANGIIETITMLDSINAIVVELDSVQGREVTVYPLFSDAHKESDFVTAFDRNILSIGHMNHIYRTAKEDHPVIVTLSWAAENLWAAGFYDTVSIGKNFSPANIKTVNPAPRHVLVFAAGDSLRDALKVQRFVAKYYDSLLVARKERLERLVSTSSIKTEDKQFRKAIDWAKLSIDALMMNENKNGVFEGIPIFDNKQRASASFPLPGAILATGNLPEAKQMLGIFSSLQDTNAASEAFGRIPGSFSGINDLADITPWFTMVSNDYFKYSNDTSTVKELYPAVKRGIEGTLRYRVGKEYKLTGSHSSAEQLLWYQQLNTGVAFAKLVKDPKSMERWNTIQQKLSRLLKK